MQFSHNPRKFRDLFNYDLFKLNKSLIEETIVSLIERFNIRNESKFGQESNKLFDYCEVNVINL